MLFRVYNKEDRKGELILDSKSLKYAVPNKCQGQGCLLTFTRSSSWQSGVFASLKVNDATVATLNTTIESFVLPFAEFDALSVEITTDPPNSSITDGLSVEILYQSQSVSLWESNNYYMPMIFTADCNPPKPPMIHSPFGGGLYPVPQNEVDAFLNTIGTSYSTLWYRKTEDQL